MASISKSMVSENEKLSFTRPKHATAGRFLKPISLCLASIAILACLHGISHNSNLKPKHAQKHTNTLHKDDSKFISNWFFESLDAVSPTQKKQCPQVDPLTPKPIEAVDKALDEWRKNTQISIERFQQGIQIATESFDDMRGNNVEHTDPRYKSYHEFISYLEKSYPLIHKYLKRELVNDFSLVFVWQGQTNAKPIMLCAHYDVVPVNPATWDSWDHPPFSGFNDGTYIWGRGTDDTKGTLFSVLEAVELLLSADFIPSRTVILAFGHDEEISGFGGAKFMAEYIGKTLGFTNGIEFLVDEGTNIYDFGGTKFGVLAIAEKGYVDIQYQVLVPGGHSSMPPDNTGIGIMSFFITDLEEHPFYPELHDSSAFLSLLQCFAEYAENMDPYLRWGVKNIKWARQGVIDTLYDDPKARYQMTSSQAVDLISGGVKVNALPEVTNATANYRIALHSNFAEILQHIIFVAEREAEIFNLTLKLVDHNIPSVVPADIQNRLAKQNMNTFGTLVIRIQADVLEVAPKTPSFGADAWNVMAGTIRSVFKEVNPIVAPSVMQGNSDTRHYWGLTKNIFRFSPILEGSGLHTVNERVSIKSIEKAIEFYVALIRNVN